MRAAVARNFRNFELLVTLGQLRSVQIFVVGYARRPGSYTVSSLSTLMNAIFAAGGPSAAGSMRGIQLKRGNRTVTELDLYDLLLTGDKSRDVALLPGDVIYFPPIGPLAAVAGSVNQPAIFELKGNPTLGNLVGYAGGMSTVAQSRQATIERIDNRRTRSVEQVDLDFNAAQRPVKDGDLVSVLAITPKFENAVTLRGNVANPLRYPYRAGMRIRDLIPDKEALITPDYYKRQNLAVRADSVTQGQLTTNVRRLADEINWEYAVIERQRPADLTTELVPFNLGKAVLEGDSINNLELMPGDIVTVFSKTDVAAPSARRPVVVSVEGEFNFSGVYQAQPKETVRQLVVRVGGLTERAYVFGTQFTRESTRRNQEERLREALDQLEQDVQRAAVTRAQSVVSVEDAASLKQEADAQRPSSAACAPCGQPAESSSSFPRTRRSPICRTSSSRTATASSCRSFLRRSACSAPCSTNRRSSTCPRRPPTTTSGSPAGRERKPTSRACTSCAPTAQSSARGRRDSSGHPSTECG